MKKYLLIFFALFTFLQTIYAKGKNDIKIFSPAFKYGKEIPIKYTCDGKDISIPLKWIGKPDKAESYVIVMYDPDAPSGKFIHWVVYDIPLNTIGIKENFPKRPLVDGIKQGKNDFGRIGYGGPCPPFGEKHRYFIVIYAVDLPSLNLSPGARPEDVFFKIRNHIVGKGEYMGVYKRK